MAPVRRAQLVATVLGLLLFVVPGVQATVELRSQVQDLERQFADQRFQPGSNERLNACFGLGKALISLWNEQLKQGVDERGLMQRAAAHLQEVEHHMDPQLVPFPQRVELLGKIGFALKSAGDLAGGARYYESLVHAHLEVAASQRCADPKAVNFHPAAKDGSARVCVLDNNVRYYANEALLLWRRFGHHARADAVFQQLPPGLGWRDPYQHPVNYLAGYRAQPVWDARRFPLTSALEAGWTAIRDELLAVLGDFGQDLTGHDYHIVAQGAWDELPLWDSNGPNPERCGKMPRTCSIVEALPEMQQIADGHRPSLVSFARLAGATHLALHTGPTNRMLTMHLPLIVPDEPLEMRVARDDVVRWREGEVVIFDDSFEHEVWHNGTTPRYILHIKIWHPDNPDILKGGTPEL